MTALDLFIWLGPLLLSIYLLRTSWRFMDLAIILNHRAGQVMAVIIGGLGLALLIAVLVVSPLLG